MSLRFLFLLNAKIGDSAKIYFDFGSILRSGRVLLYVTVSDKLTVLDVLTFHGNSFLEVDIARLICVAASVLL